MNEVVNEVPVTEEPAPAEVVTEAAPVETKPGEKTDPALLLESLQKERDKRKQLEAELEAERLKNIPATGEVFSDEGKVLDSKISRLEAALASSAQEKLLSGVQSTFPVLKDKAAEFEQFMQENPGMRIETAAKAFLVENDLLETPKPRKGLESNSGGGRTPVPTGMTPDEIDNLRVNNYNEYARRIRAGTLK